MSTARRRATDEVRALALLIVFSLASILSIEYFPDFIHIAFIAPVFFVAAAENLDWGCASPAAAGGHPADFRVDRGGRLPDRVRRTLAAQSGRAAGRRIRSAA